MTQKPMKSSGRNTNRAQIERKKRASRAHRRTSESVAKLTRRQTTYIVGLAEGKSKRQAALDAGYAKSTADNALQCIEGPQLRAEFQRLIRNHVSPEEVARGICEGLSATQIHTFCHVLGSKLKGTEHIELSHVETIDFEQRRKYLELAVKYGCYYIDKERIEIETSATPDLDEEIEKLLSLGLERRRAAVDRGAESAPGMPAD